MDYVDLYLMHWPLAFERGDELFPKDKDGKVKVIDIDYLEVSVKFSPGERFIVIGLFFL